MEKGIRIVVTTLTVDLSEVHAKAAYNKEMQLMGITPGFELDGMSLW